MHLYQARMKLLHRSWCTFIHILNHTRRMNISQAESIAIQIYSLMVHSHTSHSIHKQCPSFIQHKIPHTTMFLWYTLPSGESQTVDALVESYMSSQTYLPGTNTWLISSTTQSAQPNCQSVRISLLDQSLTKATLHLVRHLLLVLDNNLTYEYWIPDLPSCTTRSGLAAMSNFKIQLY